MDKIPKVRVLICDLDGNVLERQTIWPGPKDRDVTGENLLASRAMDHITNRFEYDDE